MSSEMVVMRLYGKWRSHIEAFCFAWAISGKSPGNFTKGFLV